MSNQNPTILLIENDLELGSMLKDSLELKNYNVDVEHRGDRALQLFQAAKYDLVLLDVVLTGISGLDLAKTIRETDYMTPIMFMSAKDDDKEKIHAYCSGGDDYIVKPFSPKVLMARVKAVLRRHASPEPPDEAVLTIGELMIHPGRHQVTVSGKPIDLTATEFGVLHLLARRPGWVFTRYQIVDAVHGEDYPVTERSVDVQIVGLRKKLKKAGKMIETVRGIGYRFMDGGVE